MLEQWRGEFFKKLHYILRSRVQQLMYGKTGEEILYYVGTQKQVHVKTISNMFKRQKVEKGDQNRGINKVAVCS